MYVGKFAVLDFAICFGLGLSAAAAVIAYMQTRPYLRRLKNEAMRLALGAIGFAMCVVAQISVVAVVNTPILKAFSSSILGYAFGICVMTPLLVVVYKQAEQGEAVN
jgi:integral membrane sensor domain MASE1